MARHPFISPLPRALTRRARSGLLTLLPGEARVFREVLKGSTTAQIATDLGMSVRTVDTVMARITGKCGCTRLELVRICCFDLVEDASLYEALNGLVSQYPATGKSADQWQVPSK